VRVRDGPAMHRLLPVPQAPYHPTQLSTGPMATPQRNRSRPLSTAFSTSCGLSDSPSDRIIFPCRGEQ
jgi:hypothetical protein